MSKKFKIHFTFQMPEIFSESILICIEFKYQLIHRVNLESSFINTKLYVYFIVTGSLVFCEEHINLLKSKQ